MNWHIASAGPGRERGYTLVEILIALTMGAILVGSIIFSVIGSGRSGRTQDAVGQMTENGQIALNLLASQVRMAGYWNPDPLESLDPQMSIWGCRTNGTVAFGPADSPVAIENLVCPAFSNDGNDVIAIRYDGRNPDGSGIPRDCLGASGVPSNPGDVAGPLADPAQDNGIVYNRFYISPMSGSGPPSLYCRGNGGGSTQYLIENVERLQISYGVSPPGAPPAGPVLIDPPVYSGEVNRYVNAGDLVTTANCPRSGAAANSWCAVTSVRICIVMRTDDNVADAANTPFVNCDGVQQSIDDRRVRRAMSTTVSLRNRIATP